MGAGKRRQIRKQITDLIMECYKYDIPNDMGTLNALAGDIMRLFPKPEVTTFFIYETQYFRIKYYKCGKCKGCMEESPMACGMHFCPYCGRRILAMEDKTLWQ